jgi:outer membrane usher protein FimD/PapC
MRYKYHLGRLQLALLGSLGIAAQSWASDSADGQDDVEFDTQMMQTRGVDPKLADWFRRASRFTPGESQVDLSVNGSKRGKATLHFDQEGLLCADKKFFQQAGLVSSPDTKEDSACFDLKDAWPQAEINLNPSEMRVDVLVPQEALAPSVTPNGNWTHGGAAGMLNYDAQYLDSAGSASGVSFMQLSTEAGFNINDWIVRSRQVFSQFRGEYQLSHQNVYAQRSFTDIKKVLQAGQISLSNSMFGTGQVLGFQMFPETALQNNDSGAGLVEGVASSQSVVEVRQSGVLVYSTKVPTGPFLLRGFSLLNTRSDLEVTVTSVNGEKNQFTVPASTLISNGATVTPGWSLGAGKLEQQSSNEAPLVGTIANSWMLTPRVRLNGGLLGSTPYQAGAIGLAGQFASIPAILLQTTVAQDNTHATRGMLFSVSLNQNLTERVGFNLNASQQTSGYVEMSDALQENEQSIASRNRNQIGGGIGWSQQSVGSFSLSWARSTTFAGNNTDYLRGSWSKQFDGISVGVSLEHSRGGRTNNTEDRAYLTLSIPFRSGRSISSYFSSAKNSARGGMRYSDSSNPDLGWGLSSDRDFSNQRTAGSGNIDIVTPISQLSGNISHDSLNYTSLGLRVTGAIVVHRNGASFSPYRVDDTFGIAKVGNEAGVRLNTPVGPTWTNSRGYAVLPSLSSYRSSTILLDTRTLAKNIDINNTWQETEAARGSVSYINFDVARNRRILAEVRDIRGELLPYGAGVFDSEGNFVSVIADKGQLFIADFTDGMQLDIQESGRMLCSITLNLPQQVATNELFETAKVQCK